MLRNHRFRSIRDKLLIAQFRINLTNILSIELLCAAQGIEFRTPLNTSKPLASAIAVLRLKVPSLTIDRYLADDISAAAELVEQGSMADAAGIGNLMNFAD